MSKYIITEEQFQKLMETGSNSAAMDLDIYVQPVGYDTSNGNDDVEGASEDIITKLKELVSMFKGGKKIHPELKSKIFKNLDDINSNFEQIKYHD